jgi:fucose 4-O-acetylase-like acetyltransferase
VNKNESVLDWILIAKGIGIVLVVIGHFTPYYGAPDYFIIMLLINILSIS